MFMRLPSSGQGDCLRICRSIGWDVRNWVKDCLVLAVPLKSP
jgi:hypothetical protein